MKFIIPITVTVEAEVPADDPDDGRVSADIIGACLAERIRDVLIPKPGALRVTTAEAGYPVGCPEHRP